MNEVIFMQHSINQYSQQTCSLHNIKYCNRTTCSATSEWAKVTS